MKNEKYEEGVRAIQTVMSLNEDGLLRDVEGGFLTSDMLYEKYWSGINKKTIFNTLVKQVMMKHEIMRTEDEKKKKEFQLLLEQPDVDHLGYDARYILPCEATSTLRMILDEDGQENIEVTEKEYEPGFLCRHKDVNIYVVDHLKNHLTIDDWKQADTDFCHEDAVDYQLGDEDDDDE